MRAFAQFFLLAVAIASATSKREVDVPRTPSIHGGGKIRPSHRSIIKSDAEDNLSLLDITEVGGEVEREAFSFLRVPKYADCFKDDIDGQGMCNSCWAFAVQKMMQSRRCKHRIDNPGSLPPGEKPFVELSPLNLICELQKSVSGVDICDAKNIFDALAFAKERGLVSKVWVDTWSTDSATNLSKEYFEPRVKGAKIFPTDEGAHSLGSPFDPPSSNSRIDESHGQALRLEGPGFRSFLRAHQFTSQIVDISFPRREFCNNIFDSRVRQIDHISFANVRVAAAPFTVATLKRRLLHGPVIGTLRLTWEFQMFTGSLFNPSAPQTFCRMARPSDTNDYCNPAKRNAWDAEQQQQQEVSPANGMSRDDWTDTWYNHFVTLHGWGVKKGGAAGEGDVAYWVVENSWGRIYDNDPAEGNNGAGNSYDSFQAYAKDEMIAPLTDKNHFLLIANRVAGARGLEITSREVFSATF